MTSTYSGDTLSILSILEIKKHIANATVSDLESQRVFDTALRIIEEKDLRIATSDPTAVSLAIVLLYIADSRSVRKLFYDLEKSIRSILPELPRSILIRLGSTYISTIPIEELVLEKRLNVKLILSYDVAVRLVDFLKIRERRIKLAETYLTHGYILLTAEDYTTLLIDAVLTYLEEVKNRIEPLVSVDVIEKLRQKIHRANVFHNTGIVIYHNNNISRKSPHPPCIQALLHALENGEDLPHHARFTLASYMLHYLVDYLGKSREEAVEIVVQLFRNVPDFNEKITRYQVQHIAGLVGGRKFYLPPNCDELRSLGLCPTEGKCDVKNPLAYLVKHMKNVSKTG